MDELEDRISARAQHLFEAAGAPEGRSANDYLEEASELIAIEDSQRATLKPNPLKDDENRPYGEPVESPLAVANEGEFPTLTDQGEGAAVPGFENLPED